MSSSGEVTTAFQTTSATTQGSISYALAGEARIADLAVQMNAIDESTRICSMLYKNFMIPPDRLP